MTTIPKMHRRVNVRTSWGFHFSGYRAVKKPKKLRDWIKNQTRGLYLEQSDTLLRPSA